MIDARTTLELFAKLRTPWEKGLKSGYFPPVPELAAADTAKAKGRSKKGVEPISIAPPEPLKSPP